MLIIAGGVFAGVIAVAMLGMWKSYKTARFAAAVEADDFQHDWLKSQRDDRSEPWDLDNLA